MRFLILLIIPLFFCACSTVIEKKIPIKCKIEVPIKPNCIDFINEFDCLKAKSKYIYQLENAIAKCI